MVPVSGTGAGASGTGDERTGVEGVVMEAPAGGCSTRSVEANTRSARHQPYHDIDEIRSAVDVILDAVTVILDAVDVIFDAIDVISYAVYVIADAVDGILDDVDGIADAVQLTFSELNAAASDRAGRGNGDSNPPRRQAERWHGEGGTSRRSGGRTSVWARHAAVVLLVSFSRCPLLWPVDGSSNEEEVVRAPSARNRGIG
jgi:hypothetical protein